MKKNKRKLTTDDTRKKSNRLITVVALMVIVAGLFLYTAREIYKAGSRAGYKKYESEFVSDFSSTYRKGFKPNLALIEQKVNEYRVSKGLTPLVRDERLCASAKAKAIDMAEKRYFSHNSPDGIEPWKFIGDHLGRYYNAGENLAFSNQYDQTVVDGWIASPTHEKNMVGDFTITCIQAEPIMDFKYGDMNSKVKEYKHAVFIVQHFATN